MDDVGDKNLCGYNLVTKTTKTVTFQACHWDFSPHNQSSADTHVYGLSGSADKHFCVRGTLLTTIPILYGIIYAV